MDDLLLDDDGPASRPYPLAWPFAALGLVGVGLLLVAGGPSPPATAAEDRLTRWCALVITPLVAGLLGRVMSRRVRDWDFVAVTFAVAAAGVVDLLLVALAAYLFGGAAWVSHHTVGGLAGAGAIIAFLFVPAFAFLASSAAPVGRARPGSIVDDADRRTARRTIAVAAAVQACVSAAWVGQHPFSLVVLPCGVAAVALSVFAFLRQRDLRVLRSPVVLAGVDAAAIERRPRAADAPPPAGVPLFDLGVGEGLADLYTTSGGPYRGSERLVAVLRGDEEQAARLLSRIAERDEIVFWCASIGIVTVLIFFGWAGGVLSVWVCAQIILRLTRR